MKAVNVNDVLKILYNYGHYLFVTDTKRYSDMVDEIANLKALEQEPKTGHWIVDLTGFSEMNGYMLHCHCSNCGSNRTFFDSKSWSKPCIKNAETFDFCPNCGADMRAKNESEENNAKQ